MGIASSNRKAGASCEKLRPSHRARTSSPFVSFRVYYVNLQVEKENSHVMLIISWWYQCSDNYFCQFSTIFGKILCLFLKSQCYDSILGLTRCTFQRKYFKNHNIVPAPKWNKGNIFGGEI
jgi:hypothetical protein